VVGQTIMKVILAPINMILDAIGSIVWAIEAISGAEWAKKAGAVIKSFQDNMNIMLTGSTSTPGNSGLGHLADPYKNMRSANAAEQETLRREALRRETARRNTEDGDPMKDTNGLLAENNRLMLEQTGAINGLADKGSRSNPARLRWGAMGVEDYWETARLGV